MWYINRIAWASFVISVVMFVVNICQMNKAVEIRNTAEIRQSALMAEVDSKTSLGSQIAMCGRAFFDGLTFGVFSDEGLFTESKRYERWVVDIEKKDAENRALLDQSLQLFERGENGRTCFLILGIVSLLVGLFTTPHIKKNKNPEK